MLTSEADGEKLPLLPWLHFPFPQIPPSWLGLTDTSRKVTGVLLPGQAMGCEGTEGWASHHCAARHIEKLFALAADAQHTSPAVSVTPKILGREKSVSQQLHPHDIANLQQ